MHAGPNGVISDAKSTLAEAITAQFAKDPLGCPSCSLSGHVTIFHDEYTGLPTRTIEIRGELRQACACCIAHCRCEAGKWVRAHSEPDILKRIPPLSAVGVGKLKRWSPLDPTLPDYIPGDEVDWKRVRRLIESMSKRSATKIYPESNGNRHSAYQEMGEAILAPAGQHDWKSLPPVPNVGASAPVEVPEAIPVPF